MSISYILAPSIFLYVTILLMIGDLQGALYIFFQPPDSLAYLNYNESFAVTLDLILSGNGNYIVTLPYALPAVFGFHDYINFYVPLINFLVAFTVFRGVKFHGVLAIVVILFFMGVTLGISKEFWLFMGISILFLNKANSSMFLMIIIARPQILPAVLIWKLFLNKLTIGLSIFISFVVVYAAHFFGVFRAQQNFINASGLQQSDLSNFVNFLLHYHFYTFPIGLFFSSLRLLLEMFFSFFAGNMFAIASFFIVAVFLCRLKRIISDVYVRPLLKLLLLFIIILSALPFPHSRYLLWIILSIVVFSELKHRRLFFRNAIR